MKDRALYAGTTILIVSFYQMRIEEVDLAQNIFDTQQTANKQ